MVSLLTVLQWLESTSVSVGIRESTWTYPIIESAHVLGLTVFMGLLLLWDLRLLGITMPRIPVTQVWKQLIPWITLGAVVMGVSGVLLFWSDPVRFYGNVFFRIKVVGLVLAVANAAAFHLGIEKRILEWDAAAVTPRAAKLAGAFSITLWAVVVICGRFVAYNWFRPLA